MAVNNEYPVLDGVAPSWADIQVSIAPIDGETITAIDISAVNTSVSVEVGEQRGASGGRILKHTTGSVSQEATITFYLTGYQKFLRALMATAPTRGNQKLVSLVHFDVAIQWSPPNDPEAVYQKRLSGCRAMGLTSNSTEGTDAETVEVPLAVKEITFIVDGEEAVAL